MAKTEWKTTEKHLLQYRHQTVHGQWSTRYFATFTDWQGEPHRDPLGDNLKIARDRLGELLTLNGRRFDFAAAKHQKEEEAKRAEKAKADGITFKEFGEKYFRGEVSVPLVRGKRPKRQSTNDREEEIFNNLLPYFGDVPLREINKVRILAFAAEWVKVPVTTGRKAGDNSPRNIGHELKFLRYLLNRAVDHDYIAVAPKIKTPQGGHRKGDIKQHEYDAMRKTMGREQERYLIGLWETGWRSNEPRKLNWHKVTTDGLPLVDLKKAVLRLDAKDVKEDYPRVTPISPELMKVLLELKSGVASIDGAVFVRKNGKPIRSIREAFNVAKEKAGIPNAIPHDIRRSTIRRWEKMGVPRPAAMQASGHRPVTVHEKYAELDEDQLVEAFHVVMQPPEQRPATTRVGKATAAL